MPNGGERAARSRDSRDFLDRPGHLIRRLQQIALALFVDQAKAFKMPFDVTSVQYAALAAIRNHPGIDQTTLSYIIAFDRTTIGGVVGRLEKKKLIKRSNGAHDRRTKSLHVTAAGERLLRDIEPAVAETQRLILAPLKPSERAAFMRMLKHLVHLNNEHSRAPRRLQEAAGHRFRTARSKAGRFVRPVTRARSAKGRAP
ncbi:MAG TPA: MarR family transcriptional regulator [Xanthobacteraceae bacterium]|nr:MarR family transcriptional regulator [Xanthobacteraceae bacterium]